MRELGSRLVRAREARGLTLEDAERDTRISRRYLQALESEQFEAIPAPVYARGFLRSYSQYLGLDAQEMLSLFPRDEEEAPPPVTPTRASTREPLSAVGPARPAWRKPTPPQRPAPRERRQPSPPPPAEVDPNWEPVIGIDIGMPSPARRIQTDPSAQARTTTVVIAAIVGVLVVALLAFAISRFGGSDSSDTKPTATAQGAAAPGASTRAATAAGAAASPAASTAAASGIAVEPGKVPDVKGKTLTVARAAMQEAGYKVSELRGPHAEPRNTVWDQAPAPGTALPAGSTVSLAVSDGPQ